MKVVGKNTFGPRTEVSAVDARDERLNVVILGDAILISAL